jgi:hypothetical protein
MYFYLFCDLVIVQKPRLHGISNSHKENGLSNWEASQTSEKQNKQTKKKKKKSLKLDWFPISKANKLKVLP